MEIIKHGKEYYTKTCDKCGCEFAYVKNEIKYDKEYYYNYDAYKCRCVAHISCPECGCIIVVSEEILQIKED